MCDCLSRISVLIAAGISIHDYLVCVNWYWYGRLVGDSDGPTEGRVFGSLEEELKSV